MKKNREHKLCEAVETIDGFSFSAFGQIAAIARLALIALETPAGCANLEAIAEVLKAIRDKADEVKNDINWAAEEVGCNYKDLPWLRRISAEADAKKLHTAVGK